MPGIATQMRTETYQQAESYILPIFSRWVKIKFLHDTALNSHTNGNYIFSFEGKENKPASALNTLFWAGSTTKEITSQIIY